MSRLEKKSRTSKSGIPNDAEQASRLDKFLGTTQEGNEKSYGEYVPPSDQKRLERYYKEAANGPVPNEKHREAKRILDKAVAKSQADVQKEQKELASDALSIKIQEAQTKEEKAFYSILKERRTAIKDRLDGKFSWTERKKGGLKDKLEKELNDMTTAVYKAPPQRDAQGRNQSAAPQNTFSDAQILAVIPDASPSELIELRRGLAAGHTLEEMAGK
jgi:hypothetical protein